MDFNKKKTYWVYMEKKGHTKSNATISVRKWDYLSFPKIAFPLCAFSAGNNLGILVKIIAH